MRRSNAPAPWHPPRNEPLAAPARGEAQKPTRQSTTTDKPSRSSPTSDQYGRNFSDVTEGDAALIDAIVAHRSERAARALVDRHSPRLLPVVRRLLANDVMSAEDVLQQA